MNTKIELEVHSEYIFTKKHPAKFASGQKVHVKHSRVRNPCTIVYPTPQFGRTYLVEDRRGWREVVSEESIYIAMETPR